MGNHFQMHHEPHQGCDIIHVQQPWHLLASATHQSGCTSLHLPEAACTENNPETTAPLTRSAPAFAVFPHPTAASATCSTANALRGWGSRSIPSRGRRPHPSGSGELRVPPAPRAPLRRGRVVGGSGPPFLPGQEEQELPEGPGGAGGGCVPSAAAAALGARAQRPRSAGAPARPREPTQRHRRC